MNEQMSGGMGNGMKCECKHHKVAPISAIVIGALFILMSFNWIQGTWPMLIIGVLFLVVGIMKIKGGCKCCDRA